MSNPHLSAETRSILRQDTGVGIPLYLPADSQRAASETLVHFGKGQTETVLNLKSGTHTLQLVFADWLHIPHDPPLISKKLTITVK